MKKIIFIFLIALVSSSCKDKNIEKNATIPERESLSTQEIIKVGFISSATDNAPLNYVDEHGKIQGFEYDILQEIAKRNSYKFEYRYQPKSHLFDSLRNKQYDILSGSIGITEERKNQYAMTIPYLDAYPITIISKDRKIKSLKDLKDKSVSIKNSPMDGFYNILHTYKESEKLDIHYTGSDWLAIKNVIKDETIAAISNSFVIPYFVEKYSDKNTPLYFSIDYNYPQEYYGFLLNKENSQLVENINKALTDMKADGTYQTIFKKWF